MIPDPVLSKIVHAMSTSITDAFTFALIPIGLAFITVFMMGKARIAVRKPEVKENILNK
jgi:hypothetical protein